MPESISIDALPRASLEPPRRKRLSIVWIIPLVAALVAIGIVIQRIRTEGPNQVRLDENNRWASPLGDAIAAVMADNLGTLLGTPRVTLFPDRTHGDGGYAMTLEVQQFVSEPGIAASPNAVWTVRRAADGHAETGRTRVREPVTGPGYEHLAAAHSRALAVMSREIADTLKALSIREGPPARSSSSR